MGQIVQLNVKRDDISESGKSHLQTSGARWTLQEKKLLDQAEFLEAMILVLDDVKLQNVRNRDFSMMAIVSEEIPLYQKRLDSIKQQLMQLRREYATTANHLMS